LQGAERVMKELTMHALVRQAYKKLKSTVYFDKTTSHLKKAIVDFENNGSKIDKKLDDIANKLNKPVELYRYFKNLLSEIDYFSYPKNVEASSETSFITNTEMPHEYLNIKSTDDVQYFIDMEVPGHILGALWTMTIGNIMDRDMDENIYANRIRVHHETQEQNPINNSPYLMRPYYEQYETWRDKAIDAVEKNAEAQRDSIMFLMDLKRYFYSVDLGEMKDDYKEIVRRLDEVLPKQFAKRHCKTFVRLHKFIYEVCRTYSQKIPCNSNCVLPIGFIPSGILSNWYLKEFDERIRDTRPIYYGRYADDLILVYNFGKGNVWEDIFGHSSATVKKTKINNKGASEPHIADIINRYTLVKGKTNSYRGIKFNQENCSQEKSDEDVELKIKIPDSSSYYQNIKIQKRKFKLFYFNHEKELSMLKEFSNEIWKNKSDFNLLADDVPAIEHEHVFGKNKSSSNMKLREIKQPDVDLFEFSKFLGKHIQIGRMLESHHLDKVIAEISRTLSPYILLKSHILWEKLLLLYVLNGNQNQVKKFIDRLMETIHISTQFSVKDAKTIQRTLRKHLLNSFARVMSLIWGMESLELIDYISKKYGEYFEGNDAKTIVNKISYLREKFLNSNMTDKAMVGFMPDVIDPAILSDNYEKKQNHEKEQNSDQTVRLFRFNDLKKVARVGALDYSGYQKGCKENQNNTKKTNLDSTINYTPYNISIYEISKIHVLTNILQTNNHEDLSDKCFYTDVMNIYRKVNGFYGKRNAYEQSYQEETEEPVKLITTKTTPNSKKTPPPCGSLEFTIYKQAKDSLKVAVGNTALPDAETYFKRIICNQKNRSIERYNQLMEVFNEATKYGADILVFPEAYLPFEWVDILALKARKNDMAIITGIEHVTHKNRVFNITAHLFPYEHETFAHLFGYFHLKTYYAPIEKKWFSNYKLVQGNTYPLFNWRGINLASYCCYELTNIEDRMLYKDKADVIVAVVNNKDVKYFSNIIDSLSRDLHTFVVQANNSTYGDTRITQPTSSLYKDILKVSGGINHTAIIGEMNIKKLRCERRMSAFTPKESLVFKKPSPSTLESNDNNNKK